METRIDLRPIATPLPVAFVGLVLGSTVLGGSELGWIPRGEHGSVGWLLLAIPLPLQLLAAVWGFVARSASAVTGAAVLAAVWLAVGLEYVNVAPAASRPTAALGLFLVTAAATLAVPLAAELKAGTLVAALALASAALRLGLTGVYGLVGASAWRTAAGAAGIAVAAVAFYAALALELEGVDQRAALPVLRVGLAQAAMDAPPERQLSGLEHEPGVRTAL